MRISSSEMVSSPSLDPRIVNILIKVTAAVRYIMNKAVDDASKLMADILMYEVLGRG